MPTKNSVFVSGYNAAVSTTAEAVWMDIVLVDALQSITGQ